MKILELFSGFGDVSRSFAEQGHEVYRVDWNEKLEAELHADISKLTADDIIELVGGGTRCYLGFARLHDVLNSDPPAQDETRRIIAKDSIRLGVRHD